MYEVCISCPKLGNPCKGPNFYALTISQQIEWIKKRKTFLGMTNAKLAEVSGIPKGTIDSLLSGNRTGANIETLRPIFDALIGNFSDGLPCPNPPSAANIAIEDQMTKQAEDLVTRDKTIEQLEAEIVRLKDYIKNSDSLHAADKENAVKEYRNAYKRQFILSCILVGLAIVAYFL